jgi:hypothetical protein
LSAPPGIGFDLNLTALEKCKGGYQDRSVRDPEFLSYQRNRQLKADVAQLVEQLIRNQ